MNIKRSDINNAPKLKLYENSKRENANNNADKTAKNNASALKTENPDKITISSEAKSLNIVDFAKSVIKADMQKDLSDTNLMNLTNLERITALKEQVKNGAYNISSKDIVAAIISGGDV